MLFLVDVVADDDATLAVRLLLLTVFCTVVRVVLVVIVVRNGRLLSLESSSTICERVHFWSGVRNRIISGTKGSFLFHRNHHHHHH
jgi:hypothetical protein